ncbi:uncharacterized protein LOC124596259 [Schistocerca americana]|uniref:uncharacterized protein LOC124596259 n=1 Tax=Schistocerca americana TaxID=7009 RepID=UPI001F5012BA|nr:uncharacterized protein LOC124596259 [Schistocerca americana]XP_047108962.1 uncharacterized protein LOC124777550 [Schistocerca piceifrons]XP_049948656.1 uncharacterized protein LOC126456878 [Schistocerca serialis cubense]
MSEEVLAAAALALIILAKRRKERRKKTKRCWVQPWLQTRDEEGRGIYNTLMNEERPEDPLEFSRFVRMDCACFDKLLSFIGVHIRKANTVMRDSISPTQRLAVTLQYLTTGETYQSLSVAHRISVPCISKMVMEVCSAICSTLKDKYLKAPATEKEWEIIAREFDDLWQFPHCIGALDGKHIAFSPTQFSDSFDNKKFNSIVLLAVVDARYRFILVDIVCSNKGNDVDVYVNSKIGTALQENSLKVPQERVLNCSSISVPYVMVAGDAFSLQPYIVKPYKHCEGEKSKTFNSRLSRARHVVDNAFSILARRFRVVLRTIKLPIEKTEVLIKTVCLLHNFLIDEADSTYLSSMNSVNTGQDQVEGTSCSEDCILQSIHQQQENHISSAAIDVRDKFCEYFSTSEYVPQQ